MGDSSADKGAMLTSSLGSAGIGISGGREGYGGATGVSGGRKCKSRMSLRGGRREGKVKLGTGEDQRRECTSCMINDRSERSSEANQEITKLVHTECEGQEARAGPAWD